MQHPRVASRNSARRRTVAGRFPSSSTASAGGVVLPPGPAYVRELDGSDDVITLTGGSLGQMHAVAAPGSTWFVLAKNLSTDSGDRCMWSVNEDTSSLVAGYISNAEEFRWGSDTPSASRVDTSGNSPDTWACYAMTRPPGDNVVLGFHKSNLGGSWVHGSSSPSTISATTAVPNNLKIGTFGSGGNNAMRIAVAALFLTPLSNGDLETIVDSSDQLRALSPAVLINFGQDDIGTAVADEVGTWTQSAITGTSAQFDNDIVWSY